MQLHLKLLPLLALWLANTALAQDEYWEYTFRPGDSIWSIAKQHTDSVDNWQEITRINNIGIGPDRQIQPGTRIKIPVSMLKQQPTPAIVIAVSGTARLVRANGDEKTVQVGDKLYAGDRVMTIKQQNLRIRFADKSELQILADSEVILDKLSYHKKTGMVDTRMRLPQGRVNTWVEKLKPRGRYQIQTPAAITAVRGTQYRLSSDEHRISRTEVTEGLVGVSAGGETRQVPSGFGLAVEQGVPLSDPVKLLDAPVISDNQSTGFGQLKVSWSALGGAAQYRYQLARDAAFNQILFSNSTMDTKLAIDALEAGAYFLRVRGIDASRLEGLDAVRSFTLAEASANDGNVEAIVIPSSTLILGQ